MGGTPRLVRRGGVFYFRMAVPKDLVSVVGRGEVKTTLNTPDRAKATVACKSLQAVEEPLPGWLLMMQDRAEGEKLTYTHEFLARIMGASRTPITLAAQSLQNNGLIGYRRGMMQVEDRAGL
jgi:hypothetical protein